MCDWSSRSQFRSQLIMGAGLTGHIYIYIYKYYWSKYRIIYASRQISMIEIIENLSL